MAIIVTIPEGYHGNCARCSTADGKHCIYQNLDRPVPANPEFGFPEVRRIRVYVCDGCLKPDDELAPE